MEVCPEETRRALGVGHHGYKGRGACGRPRGGDGSKGR